MGLLDRMASAWNTLLFGPPLNQRDAAGGQVVGGPRAYANWPTWNMQGQLERGYRLAVVMACIDRIAMDASPAPLRVLKDTKGNREPQENHPARNLIANPNPMMGESEFWYYVISMAITTGFCVIEKVRSGAGRPVQLWPLVSPWLKVKPVSQRAPDWEYRVPGNDPWPLAAEEVIVFTYRPDPMGGWMGRSPMTSLKRELAIDDQMTDFLNLLLERGGVPPIGLTVKPQGSPPTVPEVSEQEREAIVNTFQSRYGGANNWARPMFLGGLEVTKIGFSLSEMLFPDIREHVEAHTCLAFEVPSGLIGTLGGLARNTYSNAETDLRKYYDGPIAMLWSRLDSAFTRGLLREWEQGPNVEMGFDTSDIKALEEDLAPRFTQANQALQAGYFTVDDARSHVQATALPNGQGNVLLLPFSVTIVKPEDLVKMAEDPDAPPPVPVVPPVGEPPVAPEEEEEDDEEERWAPFLQGTRNGVDLQGLLRLSDRQTLRLEARSKKQIQKLGKLGTSRLRSFWKKQGERIAEQAIRSLTDDWLLVQGHARSLTEQNAAAPEWMLTKAFDLRNLQEIDWEEEHTLLLALLVKLYDQSGKLAYDEVNRILASELAWNSGNPRVVALLRSLGNRVVDFNETTRDDVTRIVVEGAILGTALEAVSAQIKDLFTVDYRARASTMGSTESQVSYNSGMLEGFDEGGVPLVELHDNPEHGDYDGDKDGLTCSQRNGMVVSVPTALWSVEGTHPNCILTLSPVITAPE